jgi:hypothetical protein
MVFVDMIPDERLGHGFLMFKQYSNDYGSGVQIQQHNTFHTKTYLPMLHSVA